MSIGTLTDDWDDYDAVIREDAHQLLAWSYSDVRTKLATAADEYEITGLLADGIDARLLAEQTPERYLLYAVHNERPRSSGGQLGKARPKLDIQIERCGARSRPQFTFEAKRMRDDAKTNASATMRQYLGSEGIGRFSSGRYVPGAREVAMLGCMQAHDPDFWFQRLSDAFAADGRGGRLALAVLRELTSAMIVPDLPNEWSSVHETSKGGVIRVFHVFIDCS
ncbi:MAG: hypothetical protein ACXW5U_07995 [Thermoanaerobaculia bacterium]